MEIKTGTTTKASSHTVGHALCERASIRGEAKLAASHTAAKASQRETITTTTTIKVPLAINILSLQGTH